MDSIETKTVPYQMNGDMPVLVVKRKWRVISVGGGTAKFSLEDILNKLNEEGWEPKFAVGDQIVLLKEEYLDVRERSDVE